MSENAFRDALELLTGPVEFWVASFEDIYSHADEKFTRRFCLFNWRADVYCFLVDQAIGVTFGNPHEAEVHYTVDHAIIKAYRVVMENVAKVHTEILTNDMEAG